MRLSVLLLLALLGVLFLTQNASCEEYDYYDDDDTPEEEDGKADTAGTEYNNNNNVIIIMKIAIKQ